MAYRKQYTLLGVLLMEGSTVIAVFILISFPTTIYYEPTGREINVYTVLILLQLMV